MSRIYISVEGQTEQEFCNKLLNNYLWDRVGHQVIASPIYSNKSKNAKGGAVNWDKFSHHVNSWVKSTKGAYHTMFFDLYGLNTSFPGNESTIELKGLEKALHIETKISNSLSIARFIPYLQVHEFEALLFADPDIMHDTLSYNLKHFRFQKPFHDIVAAFEHPEEINDSYETAPSKRIISIYDGFNKIDDGFIIAEAIGIDGIRSKCPHFNDWVSKLERLPH